MAGQTPTLSFKLALDGSAVVVGTEKAGQDFTKLEKTAADAAQGISSALNDLNTTAARVGQSASDSISKAYSNSLRDVDAAVAGTVAQARKLEPAMDSGTAAVQRVTTAMATLGTTSTRTFSGSVAGVSELQAKVTSLGVSLDQLNGTNAKVANGFTSIVSGLTGETQQLAQQFNRVSEAQQKSAQGQAVFANLATGLGGATTASTRLGQAQQLSAYQTQQLSFQLNDLFVQVASGQSPLTALIQQGSQLTGTFGGMTGAARAVGTFVGGLIGPFTVAAAAAALLTFGYVKGQQETDAYTRTLIVSGNAAGTTAGQMQVMAASISKTVGTQSTAAAALTEMAGTNKVAANSLEYFSSVAVKMERTSIQSVGKTAETFAELGRSPVQASEKLNATYNYLTSSVYRQIVALQEHGRTEEAGELAQKAYADAMDARTTKLTRNQGLIERGWIAVKDAVSGVVSAMAGLGREDGTDAQVVSQKKTVATLEEKIAALGDRATARQLQQLQAAKDRLATLQSTQTAETADADAQARQAKATEADGKLRTLRLQFETNAQKQLRELEEARQVAAASGLDTAEKKVELARIEAGIRQKYDTGATLAEVQQRELTGQEQIKRGLESINALQASGYLNDFQALDERNRLELASLVLKRDSLQQELGIVRQRTNSETTQLALRGQIALQNEKITTQEAKGLNDSAALVKKKADALQAEQAATSTEAQTARTKAEEDAAKATMQGVQAVNSYVRAIEDANGEAELELQLVGRSNTQRELTIAQYRIQIEQKRQLAAIDLNQGLDEAARAEQRARVDSAAQTAQSTAAVVGISTNLKALQDYLDPTKAKSFGDALRDSFGEAGNALAQLTNALQDYGTKQAELARMQRANAEDLDPVRRNLQADQLTRKSAQISVESYATMAGAAAGFFDKSSAGYKALHKAEQVFRAFEFAMAAESMVRQLFATSTVTAAKLTATEVELASAAASVAPTVAVEGAKQTAYGITGLAAALSLPFPANLPAFATVAAMLAAIGVVVGGGGGGGSSVSLAQQRQATQGTGTVLGDSSAKSESITKALEALRDNSAIELTHSQQMIAALVRIRDGISGMAAAISRSSGLRGTPADERAAGVGSDAGFLGIGATSTSLVDSGIMLGNRQTSTITRNSGYGGEGNDGTSFTYIDRIESLVGQTIGDILTKGIKASGYTDTESKDSGLWGLFSSSSSSRTYKDLDPTLLRQMDLVVGSIVDGVSVAASALKLGGDDLLDRIKAVNIDPGEISLKGLSGDALEKELQAVFSKMGDDVATAVLPGLDAFQKVGEGYLQTVVRVGSGVEKAQYALERFGIATVNYADIANKKGDVAVEIQRDSITRAETKSTGGLTGVGSMIQNFDGTADEITQAYGSLVEIRQAMKSVGAEALDLSAAMIRGAGGMSELQAGVTTYQQRYFTAAEQAEAGTARLREEFARIGVDMPANEAAFRSLVSGIDTTTDAGAKLFGQLMGVAGAFGDVADEGGKLSEQRKAGADLDVELLRAQGREEEALALSRTNALKDLPPLAAAQAKLNYAKEDEIRATQQLADLRKTGADLNVQLLRAQGDEEGALRLERENSIKGLNDQQIAQAKANWATQDAIDLANKAAETTKKNAAKLSELLQSNQDLQVQKLRALGQEEAALAMERQNSLVGLTALQIAHQLANWAIEDEIKAIQKANAVATERLSIENEIWQASGNTVELRRAELGALDPTNRSLKTFAYNVNDTKAALDEANQKAQSITAERESLQQRMWQALGDTASMQTAQVKGLNEVNQAIGTYLNQLEAAKAANEEAAARYKADAEERSSLEDRFYQLTNNTVAIRQKEIEKLGPANQALAIYLNQLDDAIQAQTAAREAAKTSANTAFTVLQNAISAQKSALDQTISSLQSVFDSLTSNIKDLLGIVDSTASASAQAGRDFIAQALATAQAGGGLPDQQALADAIAAARSDLKTENFSSQFDFDTANLRLAGQLSQLKAIAGPQLTTAKEQAASLEQMLAAAQKQLDAVNGNTVAVKSVADAQRDFNAAALLASVSNTEVTTASTSTIANLTTLTAAAFAEAKAKADAEEAIRVAQISATQTTITASLTAAFAASQAETTRIVTSAQTAYNAALAAAVQALRGLVGTGTGTGTGTGGTGGTGGTSNGGFTVGGTSGNTSVDVDNFVPVSGGRFGPLNGLGIPSYQVASGAVLQNIRDFWTAHSGDLALLASTAKSYGLHVEDIAAAFGYTTRDVTNLFQGAGIPRFAAGGLHDGGLRIVGENGPELEATGAARIWTASQTAAMLQGSGASTASASAGPTQVTVVGSVQISTAEEQRQAVLSLQQVGQNQLTQLGRLSGSAEGLLDAMQAGDKALLDAVKSVDSHTTAVNQSVMSMTEALLRDIASRAATTVATGTGSGTGTSGTGGGTGLGTGGGTSTGTGTSTAAQTQQQLLGRAASEFATQNFKSLVGDETLSTLKAGSGNQNIFLTATSALKALQDADDKTQTAVGLFNEYLGLNPDSPLSPEDRAAYGSGAKTAQQLLENYGIKGYVNGGDFPGGLRIVGEDGPELEATGPARIFNASQTASMLRSGGADNSEVVEEMRQLREEQRAQSLAMWNMFARFAKLTERWDLEGMPAVRPQ